MPFECGPITDAASMEAARCVRRRVFIEEQGVPEADEWDADDGVAVHFALREVATSPTAAGGPAPVIGTARLLDKGDGWCKVGRVAVVPEARGRGGGARLMETVTDFARSRGAHGIILDAQVPVIPFYETVGFVAEGAIYMEAGIPHRRMTKRREGP